MSRIFTIAIFLVVVSSGVFAQGISGVVVDAATKEAIPFANIWIKGTLQGTQSDLDGRFSIKAPKGDTLAVSNVGYVEQEFLLSKVGKELRVELKEDVKQIDEVTVKSEVPFARVVFNLIQKNKKENRDRLTKVQNYKLIENTTVYIAVDTTAKVSRFFDNMSDVTVSLEGHDMQFSPIYLAEKGEDVSADSVTVAYLKKDGIFPRSESFIESFVLKNVAVTMDFYDENIQIMDRGYVSPISRSALLYYNYYFNDTIFQDGHKYYQLTYAPKNLRNPLFSGSFTVDAETFALTKIDAYISEKANLNFINGFRGSVVYQTDQDGNYFFDEQKVDINMSLFANKDSTATYASKRLESVSSGNWLINKTTSYSTSPRLADVKAKDWKLQPEFAVGQLDDETYQSVDNLKKQPIVKNVDKVGGVALTSFFNMGKIDVGPVFDIYSTNKIEGNRITIPLRTSEQMFERFSVGGFLGYGTANKEFKYGANFDFQPGETDKFLFRFKYFNDYNLISQDRFLRFIKHNPNNKGNSNFIAVFTTKEKNPYLKEEKYLEGRIEYNAPSDVHLEASPYVNWNYATPFVSYTKDGVRYDKYTNYGVLVDARFAFGQHYDRYFFDRIYYVDPIPVIDVGADIGRLSVPGMGDDQGFYARFHSSIQGRILLGQMFVNYMLNGGYLFGDAPFDQLDLPVGSMSLGYAKFRFNLLHHASFAHNVYTNLHAHLNGGGVVLNKIPLVRKLKLREVVSLKVHYGKLTDSYKGVFDLPDYYDNSKNTPYAEIGFGVTNIFKILRVEYVRQLGGTYRNADFTYKNGIFFRTEMSF